MCGNVNSAVVGVLSDGEPVVVHEFLLVGWLVDCPGGKSRALRKSWGSDRANAWGKR